MVVLKKDAPLSPCLLNPRGFASSPIDNASPLSRPAERVGSGIKGTVQDLHDEVIGRRFPLDLVMLDVSDDHRDLDICRPEPQKHLATTPKLAELAEDQPHR